MMIWGYPYFRKPPYMEIAINNYSQECWGSEFVETLTLRDFAKNLASILDLGMLKNHVKVEHFTFKS